jgi:hypothetical protein
MKIQPLAADSLGTRSMATLIHTPHISITIDPSAALGPLRYKLPPHPLEILQLQQHTEQIHTAARKSNILIITHYHFDHHNPEKVDMFTDKTVLIKHPTEHINKSQKKRAEYFLKQITPVVERIEYADGRSFEFENIKITFSKPVYHGANNRLGYVNEVTISDGNKIFTFTSDVEGPSIETQTEFILQSQPDTLYVDGPMTYMLGYRYSYASLKASLENLIHIIHHTNVETIIIDHHLLRDLKWREHITPVFDAATAQGAAVKTAAEYAGMENNLLEARRRELYEENP